MTSAILNHAVTISVIVFLLIIACVAAIQYQSRIVRFCESVDQQGVAVRRFKDQRLERWIGRIPIPADVMTILRLVFVFVSMADVQRGEISRAAFWFIIAWVLDLADGLKARDTEHRTGRVSEHGKILDPAIDLLCFARMAQVLGPHYPHQMVMTFWALLLVRTCLFILIVVGRRIFGWSRKLPENVLPKSFAGELKTPFIAVSFGLIILNAHSDTNLVWAWSLLGFALFLECISLIQQYRRAWKAVYGGQPKLTVITYKRTGSD